MLWDAIGWATGTIWTTQGALLCLEAIAALFPKRRQAQAAEPRSEGVALLLIPAHDEAPRISATLSHFDSLLGPQVLGAVLCDNCSDGTAEIVRQFPRWRIWSRSDSAHPGKGFAVQEAARRTTRELPDVDVLVVSDTDSRTDLPSLHRLIAACRASGRTVQARTRLTPIAMQPGSALSSLAWWWHNEIREGGRARRGWGGFLQGTGMAFPRRDFMALPAFPTSDVEDKTWTVELHRLGRSPRFVPEAAWTSGVAEADGGWRRQRRRWELGHLQEIARRLPGLIGTLGVSRDSALLPFIVDFSVPPLFLFALLGALRAIVFHDAFVWIFAAWSLGFATLLSIHYRRVRPTPASTKLRESLAPWLYTKMEIAFEAVHFPFRQKRSLW